MTRLFGFLAVAIFSGILLGTAHAGPNRGGTLVIALSEGTVYTTDVDYCAEVTAQDCETVVSNGPAGTTLIVNVLAAFYPPGGRLSGVVWGIEYDDAHIAIEDHGACGDFELAESDWPANDSGTAVTWFSPQLHDLVPVYWFAAYGYDGLSLDLGPHPIQGGEFGDDSVPSQTDAIAGFGGFGFGSNPGSVVCPVPREPEGACCFPDGTCEFTLESSCEGVFEGDGTVCDPNPCPDTILGACCFADESCLRLNDRDCAAAGGYYLGDGVFCLPNPCDSSTGACCYLDASCRITTRYTCSPPWIYQGDGTVCDPNPCPDTITGACCFHDGSCLPMNDTDCAVQGGVYQGDHSSCGPNPCVQPTGACCLPNGTCRIGTEGSCYDGIYLGDGTVCDRACPGFGACCLPDGNCHQATEPGCAVRGGLHMGDGTVCDPNPCVDTITGACCFANEACFELNDSDCAAQGGLYQGDGTVCDKDGCSGACCFPDGTCEIRIATDCSGNFRGDNTVCEPNPCPSFTGACCVDGSNCEIMNPIDCANSGGHFQGEGSVCEPNPCRPTPIQDASWGKIKIQYR